MQDSFIVQFLKFCTPADGEGYSLLPSANNQIQVLVKNAHVLAFDVVFAQLKQKLLEIPKLKVYTEPILHLVHTLIVFPAFPSLSYFH